MTDHVHRRAPVPAAKRRRPVSDVSDMPNQSSDTVADAPADAARSDGLDAAARYRYESELRRLGREIELRDDATRALTGRLRDAEREAATAGGAVVAAMAAELSAWQDRAQAAEAELAAVRASKLYRAVSPLLLAYRLRRRLPELSRKAARRLG